VTLKEIEARLRREPELDKLEANVVKALARAVMRFVQAGEAANWGGPLEDKMEGKFTVVWTIDGETTSSSSGVLLDSAPPSAECSCDRQDRSAPTRRADTFVAAPCDPTDPETA
jgi:hypothetical protein